MANPMPSAAQRLVTPGTGIVTTPWLLFLSGLVSGADSDSITWTTVSTGVGFQNGWLDLDTSRIVQYGTDGSGQIYLRGVMRSGVIGSTAFTLPASFAPVATRQFPVASGSAFGIAIVKADGTVTPSVGSNANFFFDGIVFSTN